MGILSEEFLKGRNIEEEKGTSTEAEMLTFLRITLYYSHNVSVSL
jgi:hypothetical protein